MNIPVLSLFLVVFCCSPLISAENTKTSESLSNEAREGVAPPSLTNSQLLQLQAYTASYQLLDNGKPVGKVIRKLQPQNDHWQLEMSISVSRWFYDYSFIELSEFAAKSDTITPITYRADTERSFRSSRHIKQDFDVDKGTDIGFENKRSWSRPLSSGSHDHINYQVALRQLAIQANVGDVFEFDIAYRGKQQPFVFKLEQTETITTPLGSLKTKQFVQQVSDKQKDKQLMIWLATELDNMVVQLERYKKGKKEATIKIRSLDWLPDTQQLVDLAE